jgi:hypothetical protein
MLDHLQRCFPIDCALLNEAALLRVIRCGVKAAIGHGFETQSEVCRFIDLTLTLGHDFLSDPLLPWAADCLASGHPPPVTFQMLHDEALAQMAEMSGDEGQYVMRAVLRARALSFDRHPIRRRTRPACCAGCGRRNGACATRPSRRVFWRWPPSAPRRMA